MLAKTGSVAFVGVEARLVEVEVDVNTGVPKFTIVGLPAKSVREAEQRTRSALLASQERWPPARVVANLAPAGLRKDGTHFDLPIALGLIAADYGRRLDPNSLADWVVIGELGLDGSVRRVRGALAAALACKRFGRRGLICPAANHAEASVVEGIEVIPVSCLAEACAFLRGDTAPPAVTERRPVSVPSYADLSDVRGQGGAKTAVEIAAAGGHNVLFYGPPGSGKTMLARRVPGILPEMSLAESLEASQIHSVVGLLPEGIALLAHRPFRAPHHNISLSGLIGGGTGLAVPGEVSLAHHGVLFLDEMPLFRRDSLEGLRGPTEEGIVHISRVGGAVSYPARFSLVAAMNPCPCGYLDDRKTPCRCSDLDVDRYKSRLSGPLLDRFDVQIIMSRPTRKELLDDPPGESSADVRIRVQAARAIQTERYGTSLRTNATATKAELDSPELLTTAARNELKSIIDRVELTGRGVIRILRVARTIADLGAHDRVTEDDILNSLTFRLSENLLGAAA